MKESEVESYLTKSVEKLGGQCMKAGQNGWPDQVVILPHSFLIWVEVKRPGGKRRKSQIQRVHDLKQLGQHAVFIDHPAKVDAMLKWYVQQLSKGPMSDPRR